MTQERYTTYEELRDRFQLLRRWGLVGLGVSLIALVISLGVMAHRFTYVASLKREITTLRKLREDDGERAAFLLLENFRLKDEVKRLKPDLPHTAELPPGL